ncbi:MAG: HD domain-containing protein [Candidatus Marinimicrobia bacterium]|nr:HD domain-containing protein [Candidatus Neomarinimicrobiota bacterium]
MGKKRYKIIRDSVHGDITISEDFVTKFIDTKLFQRLRNIEQSGMSPVYPSGLHNRFVHSLGVFHLAKKSIKNLIDNVDNIDNNIINILIKYKKTFLVAALLHDIGHSPFSHLFEEYYDKENKVTINLYNELKKVNPNFDVEKEKLLGKPHEKMSSLVLLKNYKKECKELEVNLELACRMIIGQPYKDSNEENQIKNILICQLNGETIDVDKTDYIMRDSFVAGMNNVTIDTFRLFKGQHIIKHEGKYILVYNKSAFSVIERIVRGKIFLKNWVHHHHKVIYYDHLLKNVIQYMLEHYGDEYNSNIISDVFSYKIFDRNVQFAENDIVINNTTDIDLLYLLKIYYHTIRDDKEYKKHKDQYCEIVSRKHKYFPLWKSKVEFDIVFYRYKDELEDAMRNYEEYNKFLGSKWLKLYLLKIFISRALEQEFNIDETGYLLKEGERSYNTIDDDRIKIHFHKEVRSFQEAFPDMGSGVLEEYRTSDYFVYLFISNDYLGKKVDIRDFFTNKDMSCVINSEISTQFTKILSGLIE